MIAPLQEDKKIKALRTMIDDAERIVAIVHMSPDGDAIGSATAFQSVMTKIGKDVRIVIPDMMLSSLRALRVLRKRLMQHVIPILHISL